MIHMTRRRFGARSLMVVPVTMLFAAVPALAPGVDAHAEARTEGRAGVASNRRHPPARHATTKTKRPVKRPHAGITLDIDAPNASVLPGKTYDWPFSVTNRGSDKVEHVTLAAPLSKHLDFVAGQDDCSWQRKMAVCELGAMKHGQTKTGVLTAKVDGDACDGDAIGGSALVSWGSPSDHGRIEAAFPKVKVVEAADLSVVGTAPPEVRPGGTVPYEITVFNRGTVTAEHVMVRQVVRTVMESATVERAPFTVTEADEPCAPRRTGVVCDLGSLEPGTSRAFHMNVRLNETAQPGMLINAPALVTSPTVDANKADNECSPETEVVRQIPMRAAIPAQGPGERVSPEGPGPGARGARGVPGAQPEAPEDAGGLPHTGAPTRLFAGLALGLVGAGLVLMGLGRRRRRSH
jgi:hypothetical protein